jgi:hypothetical protein
MLVTDLARYSFSDMDEFIAYFRQAVTDPASAPPWSQWWATNEEAVQQVFPLIEYVRLKHRRLRGAREILLRAGHLPADFRSPSPLQSGTCHDCGERVIDPLAETSEGNATCPKCGVPFT